MALPNTKVEIAFNAGYTTPAASRTWTDVSTYVEASSALTITRGRTDAVSQIPASQLTLTLDNRDGRFTPELASGAYYPNVKMGRPIRVTSTYNSVTYVRFVGYINAWPVVWPDSTSARATLTITASSRIARLASGATLNAALNTAILGSGPAGYWPMSDSQGTLIIADASGNGHDMILRPSEVTGLTFGVETAPGSSDSTAVTIPSDGSSPFMSGTISPSTTPGFFVAFATTQTNYCNLFSSGAFDVSLNLVNVGEVSTNGSTIHANTPLSDGLPHYLAVRFVTATTADFYIDGVLVAAGKTVGSPGFLGLYVGNSGLGFGGSVTFAHLATWTTAPSAADMLGLTNLFLGERSDQRIARLAGYGGVPSAEMSLDVGKATMSALTTIGQTPLTLMERATDTESGVLFDGKDGTLTFKNRAARYAVASSFTLDVTAQEAQGDLNPKLDDQFLVNDVTATTATGATLHVSDSTSSNDYGYYRATLDLDTNDPNDALAAAQWRLGLGKTPHVRYATVTVDIVNLSTAQAALALAADIGTRFGLSNLPAQAPAATADLFVEGTSETITSASHMATFNASPTTGYAGSAGVWQLDVNNIDGPYILAY